MSWHKDSGNMTIKDTYFVVKIPSKNIRNMQSIYMPVAMNMQSVNKRILLVRWVKILLVNKQTKKQTNKLYTYSSSFCKCFSV